MGAREPGAPDTTPSSSQHHRSDWQHSTHPVGQPYRGASVLSTSLGTSPGPSAFLIQRDLPSEHNSANTSSITSHSGTPMRETTACILRNGTRVWRWGGDPHFMQTKVEPPDADTKDRLKVFIVTHRFLQPGTIPICSHCFALLYLGRYSLIFAPTASRYGLTLRPPPTAALLPC